MGPPETAEALSPPASHQQFPLLDSLRALAAIAILVVHVAIFSGASNDRFFGRYLLHLDIGVPFFFLLSAFLLYRPFVAARVRGTPRTPFRSYAKRRFARIAPAYWVVLTTAAIVPGFAGAFSGNWWVYYGLLQNYPVYSPEGGCATDAYRCGVPVAWSLSVEVLFYIALPLFVLITAALTKRFPGVHWLRFELGAAAVLALISVVIQSSPPDSDLDLWLFYSPLGRGWWFGLGLALAALSVWAAGRAEAPGFVRMLRSHPAPSVLVALALYALSCLVLNDSLLAFPLGSQRVFLAQYLLVGLIAFLILLPAVFGQEGGGVYRRLLRDRRLTWLGLISYGIFLWQFPVLIMLLDAGILGLIPRLNFPVLLATTFIGTIVCAALSFYAVERPVLRRIRRTT